MSGAMTIGDLACGALGTGRSVYLGIGARDIHFRDTLAGEPLP
jgi:hypothetical protein